ncbi:MAG: hypothetical protein ABSE43_02395 [Steroidobacteraceae bacterium]|jgi:hypothetical protein
MQDWFGFYALTGGAAATLLGLLFVAVSINAPLILGPGRESTRRMAEQAFQNYSAVIVISLVALFPRITVAHFGLAVLGVTAASGAWALIRLYLTLARPDGGSRTYSLRRHLPSIAAFGMLLYSAATMFISSEDHRDLLASAIVVLLSSATLVAWELLVRISEVRETN